MREVTDILLRTNRVELDKVLLINQSSRDMGITLSLGAMCSSTIESGSTITSPSGIILFIPGTTATIVGVGTRLRVIVVQSSTWVQQEPT